MASAPTNDINKHEASLPEVLRAPQHDNSGKIGHVPEVERKLQMEEAAKNARGTKPRFMDDVKAFLDPKNHPGPSDEAYNTNQQRTDVNAPNGGAKGVAPDAAYRR